MKSPRTFPRLVMKEWVQKKSLAQSGDRDMTQDARTESDAVPFNGWMLLEDLQTGVVERHQIVNGVVPESGIIKEIGS